MKLKTSNDILWRSIKWFLLFCSNITEEWPKAKEVLHPQKGDEGKKFGLQEVEVWLALASLFGAILALVTIQLIKLIRINVYKEPNILTTQSQQIVETVIKEGLESVSRTKKVVVMNLHFVPCDEGIDCCHAKMSTNGVMLTKEFHDHRHKGAIYDV